MTKHHIEQTADELEILSVIKKRLQKLEQENHELNVQLRRANAKLQAIHELIDLDKAWQ